MRNPIYRRNVRLTVALTAIVLLVLSLNAGASMQVGVDPAAKKPHRVQINLEPVPNAVTVQSIVDGGFETGGIPNTFWNPETSTNFGTPLCDVPSCGTGGGSSPPLAGAFWAWFGGIPANETATLGQTVTFPAGETIKNLVFSMRIGTVSSPFTDVLNVRVDGSIVASFPEPTVAEGAYTTRIINLNAFAAGVSHAILFEYIGTTTGTGSYVVDNVELNTRTPTAAEGNVTGRVTDENGNPIAGAVVNLSGTQNRKFITDANGDYRFENVETNGFYTVTPGRANFQFSPAQRSFSQLGNRTEAAFSGTFSGDQANPLDTTEYFVRQQYLDVLNREPDEGGFNYWSDQLNACGGDAECTRSRRTGVAAAFFIEQEAQRTGVFIYNLYEGALGRWPAYGEYATDRQQVVGGANLEAMKAAFAQSFVQRAEFAARYQGNASGESFVDALLANLRQSSGVDLSSERGSLISRYNAGANQTESRSFVLRDVTENEGVRDANYNESFVLTEYFSYLGRNPDAGGYDFWLNVLNDGDQGNYRGMVCSFITSTEYQRRFSAVVSHSNGECGQ
jgi:hypothetical protein